MVTAKIIDKETGTASVNSGKFSLCFVKVENGLIETVMGNTNILEVAEYAGKGLRDVLKSMSEKAEHSEALEMAAKSLFLRNFFSDKNKPEKHDA